MQVCYPLTMRAIPERLRDASCGGILPLPFIKHVMQKTTLSETVCRWGLRVVSVRHDIGRVCLSKLERVSVNVPVSRHA